MGLNPSLTSAWDVLNVAQTFHHTPQVKILHGLALPRHSRARAPSSSPCKLFLSWCYDISQERASTHLPCWEEMLGPFSEPFQLAPYRTPFCFVPLPTIPSTWHSCLTDNGSIVFHLTNDKWILPSNEHREEAIPPDGQRYCNNGPGRNAIEIVGR